MHRLIAVVLIAIVAFWCRITPTPAGSPYSALYAFGDSLSDVGSVFAISGGKEPAPPYFDGRFSNGPIWLDYLAARLGTGPMIPSSKLGGKDYAFGGATTGYAPTLSSPSLVPTLSQQVALFNAATHGAAPSSALYAVWVGGEDLLNVLRSSATGAQAIQLMRGAAANEATVIAALIRQGARNFWWGCSLTLVRPHLSPCSVLLSAWRRARWQRPITSRLWPICQPSSLLQVRRYPFSTRFRWLTLRLPIQVPSA